MKPTIALDLDGVLAEYTEWKGIETIGDPLPGAVAFAQELASFARILIYTTRCKEFPGNTPPPFDGAPDPDRRPAANLAAIVATWLRRHSIPFDEIYVGQGKPFAHAYIDDRAVACRPQDSNVPQVVFARALAQAKQLCKVAGKETMSAELLALLESKP